MVILLIKQQILLIFFIFFPHLVYFLKIVVWFLPDFLHQLPFNFKLYLKWQYFVEFHYFSGLLVVYLRFFISSYFKAHLHVSYHWFHLLVHKSCLWLDHPLAFIFSKELILTTRFIIQFTELIINLMLLI